METKAASADPLPRLRQQLASEYGDTVPQETLDRVAEDALNEFSDAPIREFVPMFAWRRAKAHLRRQGH